MPIKLYYFETPNGLKPLIMMEELQLPYTPIRVDILKGEQNKQDFLRLSPNGKIPALYDSEPSDGTAPIALFESGAILMYLAEKYDKFYSKSGSRRWSISSWLYWQVAGLGPFAGQYLHYSVFASEKLDYPLSRFRTNVRQLLHVMNSHLSNQDNFLAGGYSIADIACFPWIHSLLNTDKSLFADLDAVENWYYLILSRPAVKKILDKYSLKSHKLRHI